LETPERWMGELDNIGRTRCAGNCSPKAQNKATSNEHSLRIGWRLNGRSDNDNEAADYYTPAATETISQQATEGKGGDLSQVVDDKDNTGGRTCAGQVECLLVCCHGVDGTFELLAVVSDTTSRGNAPIRDESKPFIVDTRYPIPHYKLVNDGLWR
jgi:hypothetical protein